MFLLEIDGEPGYYYGMCYDAILAYENVKYPNYK
jgi:hypothetical protein